MSLKNDQNGPREKTGLKMSLERLRGRQSVRTTFRLPEDVIGLLGIAAGQFGLQQKVLLDQLIENVDVLKRVAETARQDLRAALPGRPKTFVLSKQTLLFLEKVSRECRIPRDALVELAILRLLPVVRSEREKQRKRVEILTDMVNYLRYGQRLLAKSESLLGQDDHVYELIEKMIRLGEGSVAKMEAIVAKGQNIEGVDVDNY